MQEEHTFDRYVIWEGNNFAAMAAYAVSRCPGKSYNPLLIYGMVGQGKTHLMQAIGNYIYKNSDCNVIYISAEGFANEVLQDNKKDAFKVELYYADVILIDDTQLFLDKSLGLQEEMVHIFKSLLDAGKQLVFTLDYPVFGFYEFDENSECSELGKQLTFSFTPAISELKNFSESLIELFGLGLRVTLHAPPHINNLKEN